MQLERVTTHTKPADRNPRWHVVDAQGERLGRLASKVALVLQGKHMPDYSRHQLAGDFVIVVNASRVGVSGNKLTQKIYYRHTGYVGHLRTRTLEEMLGNFPERVIEKAVKGMLPRSRLGRKMLRRLKVYPGPEHPHEAQVNAGQGKAKQAPAAAPTAPRSRRAGAAAATAEAEAIEVQAVAIEAEAPPEAPAEETAPAATPRPRARRRTTAAAAEPPVAEPSEEPEVSADEKEES